MEAELLRLMGDFAEPDARLEPELLETEEYDDYVQERVSYRTADRLRVPAYVLIPKRRKGKLPAVVAWHGHGYGSKEIVGLHPDGSHNDGDPGIHGRFAVELAKRGLVVLAPEIIGFGDRRLAAHWSKDPRKSSSCSMLSATLLMLGKTLAGLRVHEAIRAADYLGAREEVDAGRIGCMGFSGGGMVAAFASMLDKRMQAAAISAYTSTFAGSIMRINHCIDNYIPSILRLGELPELLGSMAPRALFVESGLADPLFPIDAVQEAVRRLERIYTERGAADRFRFDFFPGKHEVSGARLFDWLAEYLHSGLKPGTELLR
jgi:dienelactone hydrolase